METTIRSDKVSSPFWLQIVDIVLQAVVVVVDDYEDDDVFVFFGSIFLTSTLTQVSSCLTSNLGAAL